jgi:cleavage and polyadenylation specificity factor subunit 1
MRKGEFNIGSHVNSMFRLKCTVNDVGSRNLTDRRQVTYCSKLNIIDGFENGDFQVKRCSKATLDGSIGYVIPISEKTFRRLFMLQNVLTYMIPHHAALNPKSYRCDSL